MNSTDDNYHVDGFSNFTEYGLWEEFLQRYHNKNYDNKGDVYNDTNNFPDISWQDLFPRHRHRTYDVWVYLDKVQGPKRGPLEAVIAITCVYVFIFLSGIFGNVCTCIVIARNKYMHTATNYYLFNLAIADMLLLVVGLPPEAYYIWSAYPWIFGNVFCVMRTMLAEMSTNASILTITAFTVERYVAICHPMKAHTMTGLKRVARLICAIWFLAALFSVPLTVQFKVNYFTDRRNRTIVESAYCGIRENNHIEITFEISTFLFFVFPMTLVCVMYTLIAIAIRKSGLYRGGSDASHQERLTGTEMRAQQQAKARRSVIKMLVAVVVAFFICWAPFHAQRLMILYIPAAKWTESLSEAHKIIYYISGVCYFMSCTINPVLYSIMSLKFRQAFKQTVLNNKCCTHQIQQTRRRSYLSYRFSHKNGCSEAGFASVDRGSPPRSGHSHSNSSERSSEHARVNNVAVKSLRKSIAREAEIGNTYEKIPLDKLEECAENIVTESKQDIYKSDGKIYDSTKDPNKNHKVYVGLYDQIEANKDEKCH